MGANTGIIGGVRRVLGRFFDGRGGRTRVADRRRARPALEGLEQRKVLSYYPSPFSYVPTFGLGGPSAYASPYASNPAIMALNGGGNLGVNNILGLNGLSVKSLGMPTVTGRPAPSAAPTWAHPTGAQSLTSPVSYPSRPSGLGGGSTVSPQLGAAIDFLAFHDPQMSLGTQSSGWNGLSSTNLETLAHAARYGSTQDMMNATGDYGMQSAIQRTNNTYTQVIPMLQRSYPGAYTGVNWAAFQQGSDIAGGMVRNVVNSPYFA